MIGRLAGDLTTGETVPHQADRPLTDHANDHQTTHRRLYDLSFLASAVPGLGTPGRL